MSTSSNLDRICAAALALAVLIAALAFCAPALGYEAASGGMGGMPSDMGEPPEDMGGMPDMSEMPEMGEIPDMGEVPEMGEMPEMGGGMGGGMMGGSSDVLLVYTDDDYDSYANIFDNAKTDVSNADKDRLIDALQALGEDGGLLSMLPWDYNLASAGFMGSSDAEALVNWSIDDPTSDGDTESRPMLAWIFESEEYTELYHAAFAEFIESVFTSGEFERLFDETVELISPYVERDPTKFCTYEELSWARRLCASSASCGQRASVISSQARM